MDFIGQRREIQGAFMEQLDQVHVISDLHLGGEPGHQIFDQGALLGGVIDHLRARAPGKRVALVLNGDIVDFLAAPGASYLDPTGAVDKLEAILVDPAFQPVFQALARFVRAEGRTLVLGLGNHDVELALPEVAERLLQEICGDDAAARGRARLATDGTGYACRVGGKRALCVHGNDVDPWNIVDHTALRRVIQALKLGREPPAWEPNAGTRLVIDIVNGLKRSFPVVDLIKPETRPVLSILLALEPSQLGAARRFARGAARLLVDDVRVGRGFLGARAPVEPGEPGAPALPQSDDAALAMLLQPNPKAATPARRGADLLAEVERLYEEGRDPLDLSSEDGKLGWGRLTWDVILGREPLRELRESLAQWLKEDKTFAVDTKDRTFERLDAMVGADVDYLIAGHTHLARALPRREGKGFYFNTGTWIRLIQLTEAMLRDDASFSPVFAALRRRTLAALDAEPGLVRRHPTMVSIEAEGSAVAAELRLAAWSSAGEVTLTALERAPEA
jgi:UDP-2,3-diacylglucosamine pyrophosphatase LpxH